MYLLFYLGLNDGSSVPFMFPVPLHFSLLFFVPLSFHLLLNIYISHILPFRSSFRPTFVCRASKAFNSIHFTFVVLARTSRASFSLVTFHQPLVVLPRGDVM